MSVDQLVGSDAQTFSVEGVPVFLALGLIKFGCWGCLWIIIVSWLVSLWLVHWECHGHPSGLGNQVALAGPGWLLDKTTLDLPCGWWHPSSWLPQSLEVGVQFVMELR